jgi:AraC-like DNA-binding protein
MILQIKNMVCPRCLNSVKSVLDNLDLSYTQVTLGTVEMVNELTVNQKIELAKQLEIQGFELLRSEESKIINAIKSFVIDKVHYSEQHSTNNLSAELSKLLRKDYSILSKTFSRSEGITIEHFLINQKIEKVKELLSYKEKSVSEIAYELDYSSVAHLSGQFKKITGITPSAFKKLYKKPRKSIENL